MPLWRNGSLPVCLCLLLGACMTSPRAPIDTREYTLDSAGFPVASVRGEPLPSLEPAIRAGQIPVVIDGVDHDLETLTAALPGSEPKPLALISHGVPVRSRARDMNLRKLLPLAESFARRGYRAVIFARRGFGASTGDPVGKPRVWCGRWPSRAYARAARESANDYAAVMGALVRERDVDADRVVAVGESVGGLTVLALAARRPAGLIAVVNFAGGHGGNGRRGICNSGALERAFAAFGRRARVPALWLYSTTDRYFWPALARRNFDAYTAGGAPARLAMVGPLWFSRDGHDLFALGGREIWQPRIGTFLRDVGAPGWNLDPRSAIVPKPDPPAGLETDGVAAWWRYIAGASWKAFAVGDDGWVGPPGDPAQVPRRRPRSSSAGDTPKAAGSSPSTAGGCCRASRVEGLRCPGA